MKRKHLILIVILVSIVLNLGLFLENRKIEKYEDYITNEIQQKCRTLDAGVTSSYEVIVALEEGKEVPIGLLKYNIVDSLDFMIYELQSITDVLDFSWTENKKELLKSTFHGNRLDEFKEKFEQSFYKLKANKKDKINYNDLDNDTKNIIKEYKTILKEYIDYKENKYGKNSEEFKFINKFKFKDDEWVMFINDVTSILFKR